MPRPEPRIKIGISACLLGRATRFDGSHKLDTYLTKALEQRVRWVPVCPEVECGLGVPREPMRLVGNPATPRLVTETTEIDHSARMRTWLTKRLREIESSGICGFVLKARSPSCGLCKVEVYSGTDAEARVRVEGSGLFAAALVKRFPLMPVEEEEPLHDRAALERFLDAARACGRRGEA